MPSDQDDKPTKDEVIAALSKLGSEHEPPEGWDERVLDSAPRDYRGRVRALLARRLNRLFRLLAIDGPDSIIAMEVSLIGEVATMIDPYGMARRDGERNERNARRAVGLCTMPGCPHERADDGLDFGDECCDEHAAAYRVQLDEGMAAAAKERG